MLGAWTSRVPRIAERLNRVKHRLAPTLLIVTAVVVATLAAVRRNPRIKAVYAALRARGKKHKVALVACMRKLEFFAAHPMTG